MPKTKDQKQVIAQNITDKLTKSKSVVFTDYKGLTMIELSDLRHKLAETGAEFSITKNSLIKIGLKNTSFEIDDAALEGPTATLFSYEDEIAPIKILTKALKDTQKGSIKGGLLDGAYLDQYTINKLAQLPSKDELRAKVVGTLAAPLYGTVNVLQANLRNLVYALDQIRISKGGEA